MDKKTLIENYFNSEDFLTPIQNNLIKTLKKIGPMTRRELVHQLNTPRTTVYDNLLKLQKIKLVERYARNNGKRGRPLVFWRSL